MTVKPVSVRFRVSAGLRRSVFVVFVALTLTGCITFGTGPGPALPWSELPGWDQASPASAWPAFLNSCTKLAATGVTWQAICAAASEQKAPDDATARAFFEHWFEPHLQRGGLFRARALITGYYEPLLHGSWKRTERYRYPLYRAPDDLLTVDLDSVYPELKGQQVRGRLEGQRVVPYYSRAEINGDASPLAGNELLWVDDPVALFFLQIQGSGRVQMDSGETVAVGYAQQNGYPYTSIGRLLIARLGLEPDQIDMPTIRAWLAAHPDDAQAVMNANASYVFFALRDPNLPGPIGSLGVPLLAQRAIAVDPEYIPLGVPVWLDTELPDSDPPYRRLVFAQDTGGAIKGPLRADLFFGHGPDAEAKAGRMRERGRIYVLLPAAPAQ